jgi:hypothetical protein
MRCFIVLYCIVLYCDVVEIEHDDIVRGEKNLEEKIK